MNAPARFWNVATAFVVILILAAIVCTIGAIKSIGYIGTNRNQPNTITVDGTGKAYAAPDIATFTFTVTDTEKTVTDAQTQVNAEASSALAVVSAAGVADNDVQTTSYNISPHYEYQNAVCPQIATSISSTYCPPGKSVLTGYDVSESFSVKLRDLSKAGSLLSALGSAGVQNLNGPSFGVDNPDAVQAEARSQAISDAKSKADELAKELGVSIIGVQSFSENNGNYPQPLVYAAAMSATGSTNAAAPAPVATGQQEVTDNVTITYEIR